MTSHSWYVILVPLSQDCRHIGLLSTLKDPIPMKRRCHEIGAVLPLLRCVSLNLGQTYRPAGRAVPAERLLKCGVLLVPWTTG